LATVNNLLRYKGMLLKAGRFADATSTAAPNKTKNATAELDPEMHQTKKGNQWYFGVKGHIGVDTQSGLVHAGRGRPANVNDVVDGNCLPHRSATIVFTETLATRAREKGPAPRPATTGI